MIINKDTLKMYFILADNP